MATATAPTSFGIFVRLPLSDMVLEKYQLEALKHGISIEELLANRLAECVSFNAMKPIYFDDEQRRDLDKILGRNIDKAGTVLGILKKALAIRINGISVILKPDLLERLRTRHHVGDFGEWLSDLVNVELEKFAGLR